MPNQYRIRILLFLAVVFLVLLSSIGTSVFYLILIFFLFMLSMYGTTVFGATWLPTPNNTFEKIATIAKIDDSKKVYDIGSGDGRFLLYIAKNYGARVVGIEIDPLKWLYSNIKLKVNSLNGYVKLGNFFDTDISDADVVFIYLPQDTVDRLQKKLKSLRKGAVVVSYVSVCKELRLIRSVKMDKLYLYKI